MNSVCISGNSFKADIEGICVTYHLIIFMNTMSGSENENSNIHYKNSKDAIKPLMQQSMKNQLQRHGKGRDHHLQLYGLTSVEIRKCELKCRLTQKIIKAQAFYDNIKLDKSFRSRVKYFKMYSRENLNQRSTPVNNRFQDYHMFKKKFVPTLGI